MVAARDRVLPGAPPGPRLPRIWSFWATPPARAGDTSDNGNTVCDFVFPACNFLDDARPPPTDPLGDASLAALGLSDRLARPGNVKEPPAHYPRACGEPHYSRQEKFYRMRIVQEFGPNKSALRANLSCHVSLSPAVRCGILPTGSHTTCFVVSCPLHFQTRK